MEDFKNKIKWSEYPPPPTIKPPSSEPKDTSSIDIWRCFEITKNPCDKISMNDIYQHYKKNTPNPLSIIKFGKILAKKEGISKGYLYIGKNKNDNDYCVRCWCGIKQRKIVTSTEDIQRNEFGVIYI